MVAMVDKTVATPKQCCNYKDEKTPCVYSPVSTHLQTSLPFENVEDLITSGAIQA